MSKICSNCGSEMPETSAFCTQCGASNATEAAPETKAAAPAAEILEKGKAAAADLANRVKSIDVNEVAKKAKANPKKLIVPAVAAVAVIVLLIVLLGGGAAYTKAIDTMIDVVFEGKIDKFKDLAPAAYWEYVEDEYDLDMDDITETLEEGLEYVMENLEDQYGEKIKVSYEVKKEKELSEKKLEKIAEALEDTYDIDAKSVTAVYELKVEMAISGEDDDDEDDAEMTVAKIGGKWYLISYYEYDSEYYVDFMVESFT